LFAEGKWKSRLRRCTTARTC